MGCAAERNAIPLVEVGSVPEFVFTEIGIEVIAGRLARFLLFCEQRPVDCGGAPCENVLKCRCVTPIELVPHFIRKTAWALGRHWGRDALSGVWTPH